MKHLNKLAAMVVLAFTLAACGGGGGDRATPDETLTADENDDLNAIVTSRISCAETDEMYHACSIELGEGFTLEGLELGDAVPMDVREDVRKEQAFGLCLTQKCIAAEVREELCPGSKGAQRGCMNRFYYALQQKYSCILGEDEGTKEFDQCLSVLPIAPE